MIRKLLFSLIGFSMIFSLSPKAAAQDKPPSVTGIHRALTQVDDWLNVERAIKAEDLAGRIILVDFWTFCCINCIHVIPDLHYLEQKFGDQLTVIGVHSAKFQNERDRENIRQAILRYDIEHPVVNDAAFQVWQSFAVRSWPTLLLINPDGKIAQSYSGEGHRAELERDIGGLIAQYGARVNSAKLPMALEKTKQAPSILHFPSKMTVKNDTKNTPTLFISDSGHNRIVTMPFSGANLKITETIGSGKKGFADGSFADAQFDSPQGLLYRDDKLYIADTGNHRLRVADLKSKTVTTLAGTGERGSYRDPDGADALKTALASPWDLAFYPSDHEIAIANAGTHQLWVYDLSAKTVRVLAGNGRESIDDGQYPLNSLSQPSGLSVLGKKLYFVDSETSALRVLENGSIKTLIGTGLFDFGFKDGPQGQGLLQHSLGLYAAEDGVYIADSYNHSIRFYDFKTQALRTVAGNGQRGEGIGALAATQLNEPNAIIQLGNQFLVADTNNHRILSLDMKSKTASVLTIMPMDKPIAFSRPDELPNLFAAKSVTAAPKSAIHLDLKKGWKINAEAPSWLALFKGQTLLQDYDLSTIKSGRLSLPDLEPGQSYRLQGTLYYCEDKEGALCLIRSFDQEIVPGKAGQDSIGLNLQ